MENKIKLKFGKKNIKITSQAANIKEFWEQILIVV